MTEHASRHIDSELMSLSDIVAMQPAWHFSVPIYQRPYTWGDAQIKTLLGDLVNAWTRNSTTYFLGGVLLMAKGQVAGADYYDFELIDGQQRFTTLWLIAQRWQHALAPFVSVSAKDSDAPRLTFTIRDSANRFLQNLMSGHAVPDESVQVENNNMGKALAHIDNALPAREPSGRDQATAEETIAQLSAFVFERVKLVVTTVPRDTDLNKLFEVINNRGVQLQHHELLKARLLDQIEPGERDAYVQMWDACADMSNYIEHSLATATGKQAKEVCDLFEQGTLFDGERIAKTLRSGEQDSHRPFSLQGILETDCDRIATDPKQQSAVPESVKAKSIFGFPLFLQHALRVWLHLHGHDDLPRVLDRQLLDLFALSALGRSSGDVRSFLQLVFRLRVLFDQYVIKWIDDGEEDVHMIRAATPTREGYLNRSSGADANPPLAMLQSMLYHSQEITTQYWITPLLLYLHRRDDGLSSDRGANDVFQWLRHLDNHMFGSDSDDNLIDRSRAFMRTPWAERKLTHEQMLSQPRGTRFPHYWFYKLEFVLWYQELKTETQWRQFRLTAKNSVEHVSPQNPQATDTNPVNTELHHFGNLALVSRSANSEYGSFPFKKKRERFHDKKDQGVLESLKLDLIYDGQTWGDEQARAHQHRMIQVLDLYCKEAARNRPSV